MLWSLTVVLCVLVTPGFATPTGDEVERHKVIIVGAGVSGFTAAATLLEHNVTDLVVLEASDRIGGRIHTVEFGGVELDKGAEFVHGEVDNAVYEMISPYNLLTSYKPLLQHDKILLANTSGHVFNSSQLMPLVDQAFEILGGDEIKHFNGTLADYFYPRFNEKLRSNNIEAGAAEGLRHFMVKAEGGWNAVDNMEELGAQGYSHYHENEGDTTLTWKSVGYKTIFDYISKKLPNPAEELPVADKVRFGKQVTRVEQRDSDVAVKCADGSTYVADHVIMTVSLGVLKKHAAAMFQPALSHERTAAIESLGMGCLGKVFMLFPTRWWPTEINVITPLLSDHELKDFQKNSTHGSWTTPTTGFLPVIKHDRMLCAWFSGQECRTMETLSDEQVTDGLMELLNAIVGNKYDIPRPEAILRTNWASNPYTLGSYSYTTVSSDKLNITQGDLAPPILGANNKPVILFAGEATHPYYSGLVHGALATGRREANTLINYFKTQA